MAYRDRYPDVVLGIRQNLFQPFWKDLCQKIKFALQRAVRGYDDTAIWDLDNYIQCTIIRGLLHLADSTLSAANSDRSNDNQIEEKVILRAEELAGIADHFYESMRDMDNQKVKNVYGTEKYDNEQNDVDAYRSKQLKIGFDKLGEIFYHLWY
jgi:hypothetical protein